MNPYILLFLLFTVSCSSKYLGKNPTLDEVDSVGSSITTPVQVPENTKPVVEVISCYASPPKLKDSALLKTPPKSLPSTENMDKFVPVPWNVGEKLQYEVLAMGMNAAKVEVEVLPMKMLNGEKVWHFVSQAKTHNFASTLYYFNSKAESFINEYLQIKEYRSSAFEGDNKKNTVEKYNMKTNEYYLYKKVDDKVEINKTKEQQYLSNVTDLVSVFYMIRLMKLNDEFLLLNNHKQKKLKVIKIETDVVQLNNKKYSVDKITLQYESKTHVIYRNQDSFKKVIKAILDLKFASGTINLVE